MVLWLIDSPGLDCSKYWCFSFNSSEFFVLKKVFSLNNDSFAHFLGEKKLTFDRVFSRSENDYHWKLENDFVVLFP